MLMQILQSKPTPSCNHVPFDCFTFYFMQRPPSISLPSIMARVAAWKSFWFAFPLWLSPAKCLMLQFLGSLLKSLGTESALRPDVPKYQGISCLLLHVWLKCLMFDLNILLISHPPVQVSFSSSQPLSFQAIPLNPPSFPHFLTKTWEQESDQGASSPLSFLLLFLYQNLLSHHQLIDSSARQCPAAVAVHRNLNLLTRKTVINTRWCRGQHNLAGHLPSSCRASSGSSSVSGCDSIHGIQFHRSRMKFSPLMKAQHCVHRLLPSSTFIWE